MMRDAKDQKMDLIICASISRFARNFSDCMTQIAALKTMHLKIYLYQIFRNSLKMYNDRAVRLLRKEC